MPPANPGASRAPTPRKKRGGRHTRRQREKLAAARVAAAQKSAQTIQSAQTGTNIRPREIVPVHPALMQYESARVLKKDPAENFEIPGTSQEVGPVQVSRPVAAGVAGGPDLKELPEAKELSSKPKKKNIKHRILLQGAEKERSIIWEPTNK